MRDVLKFSDKSLKINEVSAVDETQYRYGTIDVLQLAVKGVPDLPYREVNAVAGKAAVVYIFKSIDLAFNRDIDTVVTGPIHKESMHLAGYKNYPGHTEIFAEKTNTLDYAMMLYTSGYYVIHVSTHCSLKQAIERVTK